MSVRVFIDRKELTGFTDLTLTRKKKDMTGTLNLTLFFGYMPNGPVVPQALTGREVLVYVANRLAFTGYVDQRLDGADETTEADQPSASIGPDNYRVTFNCRGNTKFLIDSSHAKQNNFIDTDTETLFKELIAPWRVSVEWDAAVDVVPRWRLRDGATVIDELHRLAQSFSLYFYETRTGSIRVTDGEQVLTGEPIVLGQNILSLNTRLAQDKERSKLRIKGHRVNKGAWGEAAIVRPDVEVEDANVSAQLPRVAMFYGDADDALLQKRAQYEMNKRSQEAKQVTVDVFNVTQTDGTPWDIGSLHYVEVPPAGVYNIMEIIELSYQVRADKNLQTQLTLAPAPTRLAGGPDSFLGLVATASPLQALAASRLAASGVSVAASVWGSANLIGLGRVLTAFVTETFSSTFLGDVLDESEERAAPPLEITGESSNE